jgi:hypothetical protein
MNAVDTEQEIDLDKLKNHSGVLGLYLARAKFKKNGREWEARCTFHPDKTPSLKLYSKDGRLLWHCFGCNRSGSIIDFVMESDHLDLGDAIRQVKEDLGLESEHIPKKLVLGVLETKKKTISWDDFAIAERHLANRADVQDWLLTERGISYETAKKFHLGFSQSCRYDYSDVRNRGWIIIPSIVDGKISLVKHRSIVEKKFWRTPDMETVLFNLGPVDPLDDLYLVSGEFDAMSLEQNGFRSISLPSDSFTFTEGLAQELKGLVGTGRIILAGDNDWEKESEGKKNSGQAAMKEIQAVMPDAPLLQWPSGVTDCNELWMKNRDDPAGFRKLITELTNASLKTPMLFPIEVAPARIVLSGPQLSEGALYGLAGDIVRKLKPETEADPAALLAGVLSRFGNVVGPTAFYQVEDTKHHCNLFVANVGATSKARKGTSSDRISRIFETVDPAWHDNRSFSGLSSGEGIVFNVRDQRLGNNGEVLDPGAPEQRMFVYESEFASALQVMKREGNTVSSLIRNAWDGRTLQTLTKNNPTKATGSHISILADITVDELNVTLDMADKYNGFCNRFLWLHVQRQSLKPHGGGDIDWTDEIARLGAAVKFTQTRKRVFMDRNARLMWERVYADLSLAEHGLVGAVISRAEAQVIRLALIYAMLDQSDRIQTEHLQAALALWEYADASARYIFTGLSKEQHQILEFLETNHLGSKSEIYTRCFRNHRKADLISSDLDTLLKLRRTVSKRGEDGVESVVHPYRTGHGS